MTSTTSATPAPAAPAARLDDERVRWLAYNLMRDVEAPRLISALSAQGVSSELVAAEIDELVRSPVLAAGRAIARRGRKLRSLLDTLAQQQRARSPSGEVEERAALAPDEFYERYYLGNEPVVLRGLLRGWPALERWTPAAFAAAHGDLRVEICADREADPRYEDHFNAHRRELPFREFLSRIESGTTNDVYLAGKNHLLRRPELAALLDDIGEVPGVLDPGLLRERVSLWLGPAGTVTPLHHDASNILFAQVYGRKLVRLISPFSLDRVYNDRECYSAVDLDAIDYDRFPLMRSVQVLSTTLDPGDAVFLPICWWHAVRSLDVSISLSFQNWARPPHSVWRYV
jgi:hypothetical protein